MNKILKILVLPLFFTFLNAQVLQVSQLFNKELTKVKKEEFSEKKTFYAKTTLDESSFIDVVTRFDGFITNLNANKTYMSVKKGDKLFSIYSQDILSLQDELQVAKSFNKSIYKSTLSKLKNLDIPNSEIQKIKSGKIGVNGIDIYSASNAILVKKNINQNSSVKKGNLLLQLASLDKIWVIASIYQNDLSFVKKDQKAKISIDGIDKPIDATIDFIYPTFDEKSKTVDVRFVVDNKDLNLYPSMFAKVDVTKVGKTLLSLPKTAVLKKANQYYVFKPVDKESFEPVKIKAKRIASNKYEILSGLKEGDEVVNNALFLLDSDAITNALYTSDDEDW